MASLQRSQPLKDCQPFHHYTLNEVLHFSFNFFKLVLFYYPLNFYQNLLLPVLVVTVIKDSSRKKLKRTVF